MHLNQNKYEQVDFIVGVIAGTPTDTAFGVNFLDKNHIKSFGIAVSENPQDQTQLQALNRRELTYKTLNIIEQLINQGANLIMIYCNSLSGAIDLAFIRKKINIPLVCPFDVYNKLIGQYKKIGIFAANCQSCANIEHFFLSNDSNIKVIGVGNIQIVDDIENSFSPQQIINHHSLVNMGNALEMSGVEVLILACTHFNYFYEILQANLNLKIFEPSNQMIEFLIETNIKNKKQNGA